MVISEKSYFDVMAHPEAEWASQQNLLIFYFFIFHYLLVPLARQTQFQQNCYQ